MNNGAASLNEALFTYDAADAEIKQFVAEHPREVMDVFVTMAKRELEE